MIISEEEETRTPTTQLSLPPQSSASTNSATSPKKQTLMCPEQDSNLHVSQHSHLKRARLPFRHLGMFVTYQSGKRGSNSRPRPWQGRALPTELFPQLLSINFSSFILSRIRLQRYAIFFNLQTFQRYFLILYSKKLIKQGMIEFFDYPLSFLINIHSLKLSLTHTFTIVFITKTTEIL